jgi:hypothetical protein
MIMKAGALLFTSAYLLISPYTAFAAVEPNFPTCAAPNGTLKSQYNSGTHGIAGNSNAFKGSDAVYSLADGNALQCFCAEDGLGIQTNWWKVSEISDSERKVMESQGWHYIPDGSAWGLDQGVYLAKNSNYACRGANSSNGSANEGSGVAGASASTSTLNNGMGQVLGLATTGSMNAIVSVISWGLAFVSLGLWMRNLRKS